MILNENFSVTLPVTGIEYVISVLRVNMCDVYMLWQPKGEQNHKPLEAYNLITHVYITYICTRVAVCVWHVSHTLMLFPFRFQCVYQGTSHSCKVNRLQEMTVYRFRIAAANDAGQGDYSEIQEFSTCIAPPPSLKGIMCVNFY